MKRVIQVALLVLVATTLQAAVWQGRRLDEAIRRLQDGGLRILYSSDLIRSDMFVRDEPAAGTPAEILDEILAPWGLIVRDGPAGSLLIVRDESRTTGVIQGTVRDGESGTPLSGVRVITSEDLETTSDGEGGFRFDELDPGAYDLEARRTGYVIGRADAVRVRAGETVETTIDLFEAPVDLGEIVVTPSHYSILRDDPESSRFLGRAEFERLPGVVDDVFRTIHRIPGAAAGDFSATSNLRGGESQETLVLIDGFELYEPFHLADFLNLFSVIDPQAIGGVELMTGGFPVEYGNRMSGVMDISPRASEGVLRTSLGIDFVNSKLFNQGSFRNGSGEWLFSARRGYLDLVLDRVDPESAFDPGFWDVFGRVQFQIGDDAILSADLLSVNGTVDYNEDDTVARSSYGDHSLWLNLRKQWSASVASETVVSVGSADRDRSGFEGEEYQVEDQRRLDFVGVRQNWSWRAGERSYLKWGLDYRDLEARYELSSVETNTDPFVIGRPETVVTEIDLDPAGSTFGIYLADRLRLTERLTAEAGIRWDRQSYADDEQTSPRLNIVYRAGNTTTFRAGWGRFQQPQRITELQVADGIDRFFPAQRSEQVLLGLDKAFASGIGVRAEVYSKLLSRVRPRYENYFDPVEIFPEGKSDRLLVAAEKARAQGAELLFLYDVGRPLSWWVSYAWSKAEDRIDGDWVPRSWDQRHAVGFSVNWEPNDRWDFNLAGRYHSGWPTTSIRATWSIDEKGRLVVSPLLGPRNAERLPDYRRVDLRASRSVPTRSGVLAFHVEIVNLLDRSNICCIDEFDLELLPDGETRLTPEYTSWLPWVPTFGIRWVF